MATISIAETASLIATGSIAGTVTVLMIRQAAVVPTAAALIAGVAAFMMVIQLH